MNILVTGGAGFIGTHLSRRLDAEGHCVYVLDNESNSSFAGLPTGVHFFRGDVARLEDLAPVFQLDLDAVCHIAGQVSIVRSFDDPLSDLRTNVEGTLNILRLCMKHRVPRLVYASSMTTYGKCDTVPTPETAPCRPDSYYGISKLAAEHYVHATAQRRDLSFDFQATSLRMYSVYGPGQALDNPYQGVLGIFLGHILRKEPITLYGDGEQTRDFVYVDDVVEAWVRAIQEPKCFGRVLNIGSGRSTTIRDLARHALMACGLKPSNYEILQASARSGDQRCVQADITQAREFLGWQPRVDFAAGLRETVRWARENALVPRTPAHSATGGVR